MRRSAPLLALVLALALAACANGGESQPFVPDYAVLPPGALGLGPLDQDVPAMNYAAWAFADPSRTRGNPAAGARAAACMDYVAGVFYGNWRWANIGPLTKQQLLQGRVEVRRALGIPPGAPSQLVVTSLADASDALAYGNQRAALAALSNPAFPDPPATLARLSNLPYMQAANVSTLRASNQVFGPGESNRGH
jgi:hypothetical protein